MHSYALIVISRTIYKICGGLDHLDGHEITEADKGELESMLDEIEDKAKEFYAHAKEIEDSIEYDENGVIK